MAAVPTPEATTIPDALRTVAARLGQRCAIEGNGERLTFAELDRLSNRVAHGLLADDGDKRERPIAILAPLAPSSLILFLGAFKAGRLFAPIDPRDPPARVQEILGQLGARLIERVDEIAVDRDDDPRLDLPPDGPAIIYFTSGSSGQPRGVIRSRGQLPVSVVAHGIHEDDRVGLILPLAFSGSTATLYTPPVVGATGCFFDPVTRSIEALAEWILDANITVFQTAPTAFAAIARALDIAGRRAPSVRMVIVGGEPCTGEQLTLPRRVFPNAAVINHYGASEAGFLAFTRIEPGEPVPAGPVVFRTICPDQLLTIVDEDGRPVPRGEPGEIHVARSRRVAHGYWGPPQEGDRPPVDEGNGLRSVQLRDRARIRSDGSLELLGRSDLRVKIHGQNVDLQAVERALEAVPKVREAVVSAVPGPDGQPRLFAHAVFTGSVTRADVRRTLAASLPPYAIPFNVLGVDVIPRNARGKIDRAALAANVATLVVPDVEYVAPRTEREEAIAKSAADVLGLPRVGVHDDLLDLGIDSFSWVGMLSSINERFATNLSLIDLFEASTVEALARRSEAKAARSLVAPTYTGGTGTPLFCVAGGGNQGTFATRRLGSRIGRPMNSFLYGPTGDGEDGEKGGRPDRTLQDVAARFVASMRETQPEGPFLLGGLSFGGLLAFEMARQLQAAGREVALLVLIDPMAPTRSSAFAKWARYLLYQASRTITRRQGVRQFIAAIVHRRPTHESLATAYRDRELALRYVPRPYSGRTLLLRTMSWRQQDARDLSRSLTGQKRVATIPGGHLSMFAETHLETMAAIIREELAAATSQSDMR